MFIQIICFNKFILVSPLPLRITVVFYMFRFVYFVILFYYFNKFFSNLWRVNSHIVHRVSFNRLDDAIVVHTNVLYWCFLSKHFQYSNKKKKISKSWWQWNAESNEITQKENKNYSIFKFLLLLLCPCLCLLYAQNTMATHSWLSSSLFIIGFAISPLRWIHLSIQTKCSSKIHDFCSFSWF